MATSSISSLGLGSDGALSYEVIDQLRAADESAQINPIDNKLTDNATKTKDLTTLTTMAATLKASTSTLSDEMSYLKRTTTVSNSAVSVTADSGSNIQDFNMRVDKLALRDIYQSNGVASSSTALGLISGTLSLTINNKQYDIAVTSSTTLADLKDKINEVVDGKVTASVLDVGGTSPYKLAVKSDETGVNNAITFSSSNASILTNLGLDSTSNHIQTAQNSQFLYNGVTIQRSSNSITDLVVGLAIKLNETQETTESTSVSITQDVTDIKDNIESLVTAYNELISNLNEATKYDTDSKTAGTFQGISQITSLSSDMRRQLLSIDSNGRSLINYGISLNSSGLLEFDSSVFEAKMSTNASDVEDFFRGSTVNEKTTNGFFTNFNDLLARYVTGSESIFTVYNKSLTTEKTSLTKERELTVSRLDNRYETMAARFASYDSIISKLNNQFSALSMMIDASYSN